MGFHKPTETVLGVDAGDRNWAIGFGAAIGVAIGALLPLVWNSIDDSDWVPAHDLVSAIMSVDITAIAFLRPAALAAVGAGLMWIWAVTQPRLTISDEEIVVDHKGSERVIRREQVSGAYLDGSAIVIDSADGRRLFDEDVEGAKKRAGDAFRRHGYPWESR